MVGSRQLPCEAVIGCGAGVAVVAVAAVVFVVCFAGVAAAATLPVVLAALVFVAGVWAARYPVSATMLATLATPTTRRACSAGCGRRRAGAGFAARVRFASMHTECLPLLSTTLESPWLWHRLCASALSHRSLTRAWHAGGVIEEQRKPRVLVVDDEEHITELVSMGLNFNGFDTERVASGRAALEAVEQRRPDLIVLDVMLPDLDGFEVARRLRQNESAGTRVPVIFLTARDATQDKVEGLRLGSDDYVTKPFSIEELIERVKAVLRRSSGVGPGTHRLSYADLELDEDTRDVWRAGKLVELTPTEYRLCHYLLANARRVLTRDQILEHVWDYTFAGNASVLETYISYLRHKIDSVDPPLIHTVRGVGYTLRLKPDR
jgi:two-component system OmpR family response regulator